MNKQKLEKIRNNRGITLIALVITIIVLLILAGVSIATLTGNNGILTRANSAVQVTKKAEAEERVKLAVIASYDNKGNIDFDKLNDNLNEIDGLTYNGKKIGNGNKITKLPDIVNVNGYDIYVQDDGSTITVADNNSKENKERANEPNLLSGMTKIMFTEPTEEKIGETVKFGEGGFDNNNWYNYKEKRWANVETEDGSMWVWIPRYAYKINDDKKTVDVKFLIGTTDYYYDEKGNRQKAERVTSKNDTASTKDKYYTHPAFTDESSSSLQYANGGWDKELTGIWVAKFEAGYAGGNISNFESGKTSEDKEAKPTSIGYTQFPNVWGGAAEAGEKDGDVKSRNWLDGVYASGTKIKYPVFTGTTYAMNYINHNDAFLLAKEITASGNPYNLPTSADSHLMKDSEWGAVAYLGQSQYGLNGKNICINNVTLNSGGKTRTSDNGKTGIESVYAVTGLTSKDVVENNSEGPNDVGKNAEEVVSQINKISGNTSTTTGGIYTWNQKSGQGASCTGTIYGIYDLSGGTLERTAAYTANGHSSLNNGKSLLYDGSNTNETSTKYTTVYAHDAILDNLQESNDDNLNAASDANYAVEINKKRFGNAIHETSTGGTGSTAWYNDSSYFVGLYYPFSIRGGNWNNGLGAGLFCFYRHNGVSAFAYGLRVVLVA